MQRHGLAQLRNYSLKTHGHERNYTLFRNENEKRIEKYFSTSTSRKSQGQGTGASNFENDEIVISGISGRFPQTESIEEFKKNLLSGKDMLVPQTRFTVGKKLPLRFGFMNNLDKFDADFFGVSEKLGKVLDPALRKLTEVVYETIIDAGINPESLRGSQTAVFVGTDGADSNSFWALKHGKEELGGYSEIGTPICLQANQVSHLLDLKGTSLIVSTACSSSLFTMETAVNAILSGKYDRAIVGATCLHLCSHHSDNFDAIGATSPSGDSRPFDKSAKGFVRGEAVVSMLLERKSIAKRNYASIKHIRSNCDGAKKEGIFCPSGKSQENLYRQVYNEAGIDPGSVFYLETHGTGTPAGDPQELQGISNVFCKNKNRAQPLYIGSVKSNMGHGEAAAGLCGVAKVLIAAQEGVIPANLHFKEPNERAAHLFDGSLEVVSQKVPYTGGFVGVSSFGIGGTNAHVILQPNTMQENKTKASLRNSQNHENSLPILVPFSGQTEEGLKDSLETACARAVNPEFNGLLHQVFKERISGHSFRGYGLVEKTDSGSVVSSIRAEKVDLQTTGGKPTWLVFPGMGSQWQGMGKELLRVDVFQESVQKSRVTLKNAGVQLDDLLKAENTSIFENIRDAFNAIAVMQIALYDTMVSIGISPSGYFGHSFGEILCGYADGCLSAEEALLIADARGRAFEETRKPSQPGGMAAVGLSWTEVKGCCPPDIVPACHNGPQSVTISGSQSAVSKFVQELLAEGIFAKEVNSCRVAAHSPLTQSAADLYLTYMKDIYKGQGQRLRSRKWVSTSVHESVWDTNLAQCASPEYFANNFKNPVLFNEAVAHVPKDAVVVEIAPQGLLQGILRTSLPSTCTLLAPMQRKSNDRLMHFFSSVGDLYNAGVNVDFSKLYAPVHFPVSAQTPNISSLIKWNHEKNWVVPIIENTEKYVEGMMNIDLNEGIYKYLEGHKLDDRLVFPATGYLHFAWRSFAASLGTNYNKLPVTFENVSFERAIFLNYEKPTQLRFSLQRGNGTFEIIENDATVARGKISTPETSPESFYKEEMKSEMPRESNYLKPEDIYKEMRIRGYNFNGDFRSIRKIDIEGKWAEVAWTGNWTTFIDGVLQASCMNDNLCRTTAVPVRLESLTLNPSELYGYLKTSTTDTVPVSNNTHISKTFAPGIQVSRLKAHVIQRKNQKGNLSIGEYAFAPYFEIKNAAPAPTVDIERTLTAFIDIFFENHPKKQIQICDNFTRSENFIRPLISKILSNQPLYEAHVTSISTDAEILKLKTKYGGEAGAERDASVLENTVAKNAVEEIIAENKVADLVILDSTDLVQPISNILADQSWLILRNIKSSKLPDLENENGLRVVAQRFDENSSILLLRKILPNKLDSKLVNTICIDGEQYDWLPRLKTAMANVSEGKNLENKIYIYSQNNPTSGIVGLVKCLRREPGADRIRCIFDPEGKLHLNFDHPDAFLAEIIEKDLVMNIFKNGAFGSYRHSPISSDILTTPTKEVNHACVNTLTVGDLSSLRWIESRLKLNENTALCTVNYASLNFRDIMLSTAKLPMSANAALNSFETQIGLEFSGRDHNGVRVMGMAFNTLALSVLGGQNAMLWNVPSHWSLEEAATVPVVYATAYYALCDRSKLQNGQSILIHSGTGGVGQAAINIALSLNCEVFTSVGTPDKRKYIKQLFPSLKDSHICNSRDTSFEQQILEATRGRGVDFILNSLAEDKLKSSLNCLAIGGHFSEIGKVDILKNSPIGMEYLGRNVDISGVDLVPLFTGAMPGKERLVQIVGKGIQNGVVKPLERSVFSKEEIEEAFRYMAAGKHMGKVLIQVQKENQNEVINRSNVTTTVKAIPRSYFDPKKTYVVVGGLGGFGLELANWLIDRGARNLVLMSRSGVTTGYQKMCLNKWAKIGAKVQVSKTDLSNLDQATESVKTYSSTSTIGGIFNSGMVLKDALIENQTAEMFEAVSIPKVEITKNLDELTRKHCPDLDYFVCFSSLSAGLGNAGQSNYGLANSQMEHICHARKGAGLHALAIQWGVIGDVGYVAENMAEDAVFDGMNPQRISSCLEVLDALIAQSMRSETSAHAQNPQSTQTVFSSMVVSDKQTDRKSLTKIGLTEAVARLCSIKSPLKDIDLEMTLVDLGLDSLSGTELQQLLEREYDTQMSTVKIRSLTWGELKSIEQGKAVGHVLKNTSDPEQFDAKTTEGSQNSSTKSRQSIVGVKGYEELPEDKRLVKLKSGANTTTGDQGSPLFIVHGGDGQSSAFTGLARKLKREVYAFQTGGKRFGRNVEVPLLEEMAKEYVKELKLVQPNGPYNIAGYSVGGCIAFEIANQLENIHKDKVENLLILDGYCFFGMSKDTNIQRPMASLLNIVERIISLSDHERTMFLDNLHPTDLNENRRRLFDIIEDKLNSQKEPELKYFYETMVTLGVMAYTFKPTRNFRKFKGQLSLIKAESSVISNLSTSKDYDFQQYCENPIRMSTVRGDHQSIFYPENLLETVKVLNTILEPGEPEVPEDCKDAWQF